MKKFIGIIAIIALVTVSAFADPLTSSDTLDVTLQVTGLLEAHWTAASMSDSTYDTELADISTLSLGTITGGSGTVLLLLVTQQLLEILPFLSDLQILLLPQQVGLFRSESTSRRLLQAHLLQLQKQR